jgi:imidazolonepropionase-like amidohydrolase
MGSHGQLHGLASQWELWAIASGGMTPLEMIRTGTITAAQIMGMEDDIGSLEPGKLADLVILNKNPMDDIHNTNAIRSVMKAGTLWDGDTMDELWPAQKKRPKGVWEDQ